MTGRQRHARPGRAPLPPPLTDAEQAVARDAINAHLAEQVNVAEVHLLAVQRKVREAHEIHAAWLSDDTLPPMQAILVHAAAGQDFITEANKVISGSGSRERADELRTRQRLVARYLLDHYGHQTGGEGNQ